MSLAGSGLACFFRPCSKRIWVFPQIRGTYLFGVPIVRIVFIGFYIGVPAPILGNCHVGII